MTDATDHFAEKGHARWRGNFYNYHRILTAAQASASEWSVIMQDDVSVPVRLFQNIKHIAAQAPPSVGMLAFYVPQNGLYERAIAGGYSVVETYHNFWIQCMAIRRSEAVALTRWATEHVLRAWEQNGDGGSDDDTLNLYCSVTQRPCRTILPSFVQHIGAGASLMNTREKIGRWSRTSGCYDPNFDATTVNWRMKFAEPLVDRSRISRSSAKFQRAVGL
jgi:hypothetical protein